MRTLEEERAHEVIVRNEWKHIKQEFKLQITVLAGFLATFWGLFWLNNGVLNNWFGINFALEARSLDGILGILLTPFLHLTTGHVITSSILLLVLGWWVMMRDTRDFFLVHIVSMLTCGAAVWMFETDAMRWFGWGGVAMGMAGYLLSSGLFERRWPTIISSLVAIFLIGSPVLEMLTPGMSGSWIGIMGGFFGGVLSAAFLGWRRKKKADPEDYLGDRLPKASELVGVEEKTTFDFSGDVKHVPKRAVEQEAEHKVSAK